MIEEVSYLESRGLHPLMLWTDGNSIQGLYLEENRKFLDPSEHAALILEIENEYGSFCELHTLFKALNFDYFQLEQWQNNKVPEVVLYIDEYFKTFLGLLSSASSLNEELISFRLLFT